jgi:hypothetical protein
MKNFTLQAAERIQLSDNWIALLFAFCLLILFLLKLFDAEKMKGYSLSIFSKGFAEMISKEKQTIFSLFHLGFNAFLFLNISLLLYFFYVHWQGYSIFSVVEFSQFASYFLVFLLGRNLIEFLLIRILGIDQLLGYFVISKRSYLYSISVAIFFLNILYYYGFERIGLHSSGLILLLTGIILLFGIRFVLILANNKNLIIKELFYFILYLCSFEIAPLFILFKLTF